MPVYYSFLIIAQHIAVKLFLCNEVRKIKPPHNPEKWTLGRINSHSFNNILSRFSGTRKSNKNFIPTITVHHLCKTRILYRICIDTTKWFCGSLVFLILCKWLFHWTICPTLVYTMFKEAWLKNIAANKAHFLQPMLLQRCANAQNYQTICAKSHFAHLQRSKTLEKRENKKLFKLNV